MDILDEVLAQAQKELESIVRIHDLDQLKAKYIGKTGKITAFMQELRELPLDQKKERGLVINQVKSRFEEDLQKRKQFILEQEILQKLGNEKIDVTLDDYGGRVGSFHPISLSAKKMIEIFNSLGFSVASGPEIESDYYNFEALNIPKNHPARAMQDTFYTEGGNVLRTHTSPVQVRYAKEHQVPIKIIAPGRVYRVDMDATHSPMFHQLEGLWIDEGISFANLKAVVIQFLRCFFEDEDLKIRFRASFFPFTEPSAEVDIMSSNGKWLEVMGCGMVHPKVLEHMGIDPHKYSGFAFGVGIDRFTMLRYQIDDLRLMFENDLDFLNQFKGVI